MSYERLAHALLQGRQYYGPALRSLQGLPERHRCMQPVVEAAAAMAGDRPLNVLEIGSWAGGSAVSWALAVKALPRAGRVLCVDAWKPYFDVEVDREPIYAEMNAAVEHGEVFRLFLHNLQSADVADLVDYKVGATRDILPQLEPASFDIIYVDGSHAVDDVTFDVTQAMRLIRDGGIVCGDDLELPREAVDAEEHRDAVASGSRLRLVGPRGALSSRRDGSGRRAHRAVFMWNGFWAAQRTSEGWLPIALKPGPLPDHIAEAIRESADEEQVVPEMVGETAAYRPRSARVTVCCRCEGGRGAVDRGRQDRRAGTRTRPVGRRQRRGIAGS